MVDNGSAPIVVGVDGSESGVAALSWAVAEAARRGCAVEAVVVAETERPEITAQVEAAGAVCPEVRIRYVRATGAPGPALVRAAHGAVMLVVGSHGHGRLAGALLGSVGMYCTERATCPVLVVPDPARARKPGAESDVDVLAVPGPLL